MKSVSRIACAVSIALFPAMPAFAGWKLVPHGVTTAVAKSSFSVTPSEDWNRSGARVIAKSETWTLDGVALNELYFVSGLAAGESLFKDAAKKDKPLPTLGATAQLSDIPDFVESSIRIGMDTSVFEMSNIQPTTLGGHAAVKFNYDYAAGAGKLRRRGVAIGTILNKQLYLISFTAPALYYFDRDAAKAEAIMTSAKL